MDNADVVNQVIEYLVKKGYNRTEQTLRMESANLDKDGRPIQDRAEDQGTAKYAKAYTMLSNWIESNLDIYKVRTKSPSVMQLTTCQTELRRLLWPIFLYSFLDLIAHHYSAEGEAFLIKFSPQFEKFHGDHLRILETIKLQPQLQENEITRLYLNERYRIPLNVTVYYNLMTFLESNEKQGGSTIIYILQTFCEVKALDRGPLNQFSFEAIIQQAQGTTSTDNLDQLEGVPGAFTGVINKDIQNNNVALKLGMMAMESDLAADVRAELEELDVKNPPAAGQQSLVEAFDSNIKREDSADGPSRNEIPLPPSRARDVVMEVQKIRENRDRFKIEGRTGGVGPGVSVCMYTFHNTLDR
jgi:transcription initiation factor TFIID subunit 5